MSFTKTGRQPFGRRVSSERKTVYEDYRLQRSPNTTHEEISANHHDQSKVKDVFDFHGSSDDELDHYSSKDTPVSSHDILKDVVAYIEVRSNTENRFEGISKQMEMLGAKISKKFTSDVTHVVFKDGKKSTKVKAIKKGVHLVSVLWIDSCKRSGKKDPEEEFPVSCGNNVECSPLGRLKRSKSMQPKSFEEEVKLSEEKLKKRKRRIDQLKARTPVQAPSPFDKFQDVMTCSPFVVRPSLTPHFVPHTPGDFLRKTIHTDSLQSVGWLIVKTSNNKRLDSTKINGPLETKQEHCSHSPGESYIEQLAKKLRFDCECTDTSVGSPASLTRDNEKSHSDLRQNDKKKQKFLTSKENSKSLTTIPVPSKKQSTDTLDESMKEHLNPGHAQKLDKSRNSSDEEGEQTRNVRKGNDYESKTTEKHGLNSGHLTTTKTGRQRTSLEDFREEIMIVKRNGELPDRKRKRISRSLVTTSLHYSDQEIVHSVVKKLGLFLIHNNVSSITSHVIAGNGKRTLNALNAISRGCWILSLEWIMKSLEAGFWIEEEPYELSDTFPSAQLCRLERATIGASYHSKLLADVPAIYVGSDTSPPSDDLDNLILISGGHISHSFRNASICIGEVPKKIKAIHVTEKWLLDCITSQSVLPFEKYQTEQPHRTPSPSF